MKKYIFLAASALTLASCSSDDFLGDTPGSTPTSANSAIKFDGNAGKISRTSNSGTTAEMLGNEFKIYGVKSGATSGTDYNPVFKDYLLWYDDANKNTTTNKSGWEYVGGNGNHGPNNVVNLTSPQTIKFWDYASADYRFVAGAPSTAFEFKAKTEENDKSIESATIKGLGGHIKANTESGTNTKTEPNPVYVAKPVVVSSGNYKQPVTFTFIRHQTKVRVGIYETIPGYSISSIKFYKYADDATELSVDNDNNIILTSATADYFYGGTDINGTISYDWTKTPAEYTFTYTGNSLTKSKNWYGGKFESGVPATASTATNIKDLYGTDGDMLDNGYFTVLPTPSETDAQPILIKCDYTLTADDKSGETINVKGATAAIPAAYSKWNTNTLYTYLFKISENTNGYTGNDPNKTGLYPITFDAAVEAPQFGMQGTITTFTTPSITTYQVGSVTDNGIEYKSGTPITVKVTNPTDGTDLELNETDNTIGKVAVYKLTKERTEADLQLASVSKTEFSSENKQTITLGTDNKSFTFTPSATAATTETTVKATNYYAIQYLATAADGTTPAAYTYKVVKVVTAAAK